MSLGYLGVAAGAVLGGQIAGRFSFQYVFYLASALMFLNAIWVYFRVYKKWDQAVLSEERQVQHIAPADSILP
jgi:predicted MFS family arabinose efflux permease